MSSQYVTDIHVVVILGYYNGIIDFVGYYEVDDPINPNVFVYGLWLGDDENDDKPRTYQLWTLPPAAESFGYTKENKLIRQI